MDLVKKLERQLSVLADPLIVEAAFKKCAQLKSEIDSMPQQQQISINSKRVSELYSVMEKAEEMMDIVPLLLDRFSSLQSVHQELASFAETAQTVGREQTVVADTIKTTSQTLERVNADFITCIHIINS